MMENTKRFDNYPGWIVVLSNFVSLGVYALGIRMPGIHSF
jgi:hypothetical protein